MRRKSGKKKVEPFKFAPFSLKQRKVLTWWCPNSPYHDYDVLICDGAVRSGKTVAMILSYVMWATSSFNGMNFGLAGKTIGSLRRNVIKPLKQMLLSRGYSVTERRTDNYLTITKGKKSNDFYLFGGKDESSQDLIQGITLAGMFFDEIALMPQSFVNQATARCSVSGAKIYANCNPEGPYHYFKKEWIDKVEEKRALYLHFTMNDNLSLDERVKERYRNMYTGVFKKRYIDGEWCVASGIIYDMFNEDVHIQRVTESIDYWDTLYVSCDYGTKNPCTFGLFGVKGDWVHQIRSYYYDGREKQVQKSDSEYAEDMCEFLGEDKHKVKMVLIDPSAASFITELNKKKYDMPLIVKASNDVLNGIRTVQNFLRHGRLTVDPSCTDDIKEFRSYCWDEKLAKKGIDAPIKENDHACDKIRYLLYTVFGKNMIVKYDEAVYQKGKQTDPIKQILKRRGTKGQM